MHPPLARRGSQRNKTQTKERTFCQAAPGELPEAPLFVFIDLLDVSCILTSSLPFFIHIERLFLSLNSTDHPPHSRRGAKLRTNKLPDKELLRRARVARQHLAGARTDEINALARELIKRAHLIFGELLNLNPGQNRIEKSSVQLRKAFPCLTKDEAGTAITIFIERNWLRRLQGSSIVEVVLRDVEQARKEIEGERSAGGSERSSRPPPAANTSELPKDFNRVRVFEAIFGRWGNSRHEKKVLTGRVKSDSVQIGRPHERALKMLHSKGRKSWTLALVVLAIKALIEEGFAKIVGGSFEELSALMVGPIRRPGAVAETPSQPPPPPVVKAADEEPTKQVEEVPPPPPVLPQPPIVEVKEQPVVATAPPVPVRPKLTKNERLVLDALRKKKPKEDKTIEGPVSIAQQIIGGPRDQAIKVLNALIRKGLLSATLRQGTKRPKRQNPATDWNWNTVKVVAQTVVKRKKLDVVLKVIKPAVTLPGPDGVTVDVGTIIAFIHADARIAALYANQQVEREAMQVRHQKEIEAAVLKIAIELEAKMRQS